MAKILLVEDDAIQRMTYRRFLELEGHNVTDVDDGIEALKVFAANPGFDVVVTDVLMPGLDGSGLIHGMLKIRPDLPVIAISAGRRVLTPEFALESANFAGSTFQLTKPFSRADLKGVVDQAVRR